MVEFTFISFYSIFVDDFLLLLVSILDLTFTTITIFFFPVFQNFSCGPNLIFKEFLKHNFFV